MTEIEFLDNLPPAPSGRRPGFAAAFVEALRANPGKWALYPTNPTAKGSSSGVRGYLQRRYGCEVASRTIDGQVRLYVRWNGEAA